jgi:UDP-N-acetylmuramoyl-tripeptide--D-alanyl-D-alanine ligase
VVPEGEALLEPHLAALDPGVRVLRFGDRPDLDLALSVSKGWELRNAAAALACCRAVGAVPPEGARVEVGLSDLRGEERPLAGGGTLIADCYNANPLAMAAALADLAGRPGRRVAVLGDMLELGPEEERYHREVGEEAARLGVEVLVAVGPRAAWCADAADGGAETLRYAGVEEAAEALPALLRPGDVVLLKGSRGMALERLIPALAPGD